MTDVLDLRSLAELCAEVIGIRSVDPASSFHDAGGDSVSAARLVILLDERWGHTLDIFTVIAADSLRELHAAIVGDGRDRVAGRG